VTHAGDARPTGTGGYPQVPGVMTYGAATAGEVLVDRYRLEEHVDTDAAGRQIWRGVDVVLRRPVALVIRQPGGEPAAGMLTAAVAASRIVHPHLVSVYDAIDEGHRAYLVREWVPGVALRDVLGQGPLDAERATLVTHAVAEAVAALHSAGIVHGNVHPGTILVADDGRVVLLDAHADAPSDPEFDVRAVGAVLYACLTGHWPYAEAGRSILPDAPRDARGLPARPRQVRGGVPGHLDEIAAELLDAQVAPPEAGPLAAEFARLASAEEEGYEGEQYGDEGWDDQGGGHGPMGFRADGGGGRRRGTGKLIAGVAALVVVAAVGIYGAINLLSGSGNPESQQTNPGPVETTTAVPQLIALTPGQVRIVDPPGGNRAELAGAEAVVDGDTGTGWSTDEYLGPADFGGIKPGMGILINLGSATKVDVVQVSVAQTGATLELRSGTADPGNTSEGDNTIAQSFTVIGTPIENAGTTAVFQVPPDHEPMQYLVIWISKLPPIPDSKFQITVNEIEVRSSTP
jgi:eukaryotic-like serine/threonine-protein kinase